MKKENLPAFAVLLAGGRGTRFWPRSRARTPKQLLSIVGEETMLRQTWERLSPAFPPKRFMVVTNREQAASVRQQLRGLPIGQLLAEPAGRNTAAAIALAAVHLAHQQGDALMAVLPADHYITNGVKFRRILHTALEVAKEPGTLVMMGIPPTHPETGFGYVERARTPLSRPGGTPVYEVRRFTEKPPVDVARRYVASGRYYWNAGMFFWRVSTFLECLAAFLPATRASLAEISSLIGKPGYDRAVRRHYPRLENISVDYAVMERATRNDVLARRYKVVVLPAEMGWNDLGSWSAVYDLLAKKPGADVTAGPFMGLDTAGNFIWSPKKLVAAIGVRDLILVETEDAILLCPRNRAQDVGKIVKWLEERNLRTLL